MKYQKIIGVNLTNTPGDKVPKFTWTQCNFTHDSFYISEQIYIYVKINTCVNVAHVNGAIYENVFQEITAYN